MDPVSAAGLALGVIPLALQLLGGCIKGYEMFLGMLEMPSQYEHLRVRMRLEQARLLNWGEKIGLLEETLEQPSLILQLHRNLIVDILSEIQRLFRDCLRIQTKIESNVQVAGNIVSVEPAGQFQVQRSQRNALFSKALRAWEKTTEFPTRLQWVVVKQEKFEGLVEKLISYNDSIVSLLDRTTIQQLYDMQIQSQLTMLQLTSKVEDLHKLAQAIQVQTSSSVIVSSNVQRPNTTNEFARLASFKAQQLTLEADPRVSGASLIDRTSVSLADENATRTLAVYQEKTVWVEWKEYDSDQCLPSVMLVTEQRIQKLAILLNVDDMPKEFRAPHCIGYTKDTDEDTTRWGLVYSIPGNNSQAEPLTLLDMIRNDPKSSLTKRIALATVITSSLMYLHSVNWLHKGIRSANIVFFTAAGQKVDYATPTISGFEYARPDLPEELTEKPPENFEQDIYRHPNALGRWDIRSKKSWDIYSLGVVLIELAFWKSINEILDLHQSQKDARRRLRRVRDTLLTEEFLDSISAEIGTRYMDVVRRCITGGSLLGIPNGANEEEPAVGAEMQCALSEHVLGKLRSIEI